MAAPRYDPNVLKAALAAASQFGATPREQKALVEAGLVESGIQHLSGGDRDSTGFLQQRPSQGWGPVGESVGTDTAQFLRAARKLTRQGFKGSAGALAQAVQRSAFPGRYDERAADAEALLGGGAGGDVAGGRGPTRAAAAAAPWDQGAPSTAGVDVLAAALARQRPQVQSSGVQAPSFAAAPALPQGYQAAPAGGGPQPKQDPLADALRAVAASSPTTLPESEAGAAGASGAEASPQARAAVFSGRSPTARAGKVIGTPHAGTHTLGNWQSDNAVDIAVPAGTPMVALQDGVVVKVRKHPQGAGRFAGDQVTIRGRNGNEYFYAHGVADVKPGQRVRRGQEIGVTGSANGVEHLHFGVERGDPRKIIGRGR